MSTVDASEVEDDDKMIVVVIGDGDEIIWENENEKLCTPIKIKEEPMNQEEVMEIISAAETYGQRVKLEYEYEKTYYDEDEFSDTVFENAINNIKVKLEPFEGEEEYCDEEGLEQDDEYVPSDNTEEEGEQDSDSDKERPRRKKNSRHAMVPIAQRKSFIDDLRQQYPELKMNEKALIKTVAEIMRNIKAPSPPDEFCVQIGDMFECISCQSFTPTFQAAGRHWQEKHGPRYLVCFACGVDFRSKTNLYKHEKRCMAIPDAIIMLKARALFLGRKGRGRPFLPDLSKVPQLKPKSYNRFNCTECSATFTTKVALTAHLHMHRGERPYWCDKCPSGYTSLSALTRHQQKHSDQKFICDTCQREFKVKAAIVAHMDTHNPVPKFPCAYVGCARRYTTKNALNHHVRREHLHLPMPCACQICPSRYPRMSLLRDHMKKKHGMALMTRKMFFKALPRLTDEQIQQAKVILKGEGPPINLSADLDRMEYPRGNNKIYDFDEYILGDL